MKETERENQEEIENNEKNLSHILTKEEEEEQLQLNSVVDPTHQFSMLHLHCPAACHFHHHPSCCATAIPSTSLKRRSPFPSSGEPSPKKPSSSSDQEDDIDLRGYTIVALPDNGGCGGATHPRVLRRCVSDPCKSPAASFPVNSPECGNPVNSPVRGCGLPPLHPLLKRCTSELTPSPARVVSNSFSSDESPDSKRLRRMKGNLRVMRQLWDEVVKDEEEEQDNECADADDKVFISPQDEIKGHSEEAVRVEWAKKCLRIIFGCACGKSYEVLISGNKIYYKLV
ncbi:hypothetical protein TanjilG_15873 [Lupinus angustifolius]|uniref:Uncharacterized protein n=1 Tax=Lupinus angustifolius TaxID=3871 RepID=A0A1J7GHS0_LUPAN|nr:PREDICTED: uncharacterized protein LOC109340941 [Lupinus angustifolius]OIV89600.1 hypothetical protein TanjilG_15873 [Lupinus angustifolius]